MKEVKTDKLDKKGLTKAQIKKLLAKKAEVIGKLVTK
jgi:hypothetical protein